MKDMTFNLDIVIFLILLVLKLTGTINWSWWFICLPLYFIPGLFVFTIIIILFILLIQNLMENFE